MDMIDKNHKNDDNEYNCNNSTINNDNKLNNEDKPIKLKCQCCRKKLGIIKFNCSFCNFTYCLSHQQPELHNCESIKIINKVKIVNITPLKVEKI